MNISHLCTRDEMKCVIYIYIYIYIYNICSVEETRTALRPLLEWFRGKYPYYRRRCCVYIYLS